ncbi:MAG: ATP-dependent DNA helicase RecG [Acidimicrobiales bacterium]
MAADDPPLTLGDLAALPVTRLKGVGEQRAKALDAAGIGSVLDLLTHYPRRYIDRTREADIASLEPGEEGMVLGTVQRVDSRPTRNRRKMVNVVVSDGTGRMTLTFFGQPWRERQLREDMAIVVFGKMELFRGARQMTNPIVDLVGDRTGRIVPVYPQSEKDGLHTWELAAWIEDALAKAAPRGFAEPMPDWVLAEHDLIARGAAFAGIHLPATMGDVVTARRRLVFDELLRVQLLLVLRKRAIEASSEGVVHDTTGRLFASLVDRLAFGLTGAQRRAIDEITADLASTTPMHRLLQGDVGAGKTLVAVAAMLAAVEGGHQAALMAPTEVLAEQHDLGIRALLEGFVVPDPATLMGERELRVGLFTSRNTAAERRRMLAELAAGSIDIAVGTHALISEGVDFASLGVVVIDEQHRFGVDQRAALRDKGAGSSIPDVLVMTATPIPRTAAMTVYGDLDVSVLDELPPGRTPIDTRWVQAAGDDDDGQHEVWEHVRSEVAVGHQAYVVCPLIDESEKLEVASAEATHDRLTAGELSGLAVGLLHGRMASADKEEVMDRFRSGELDVLVSTTVIEVGVDVPNASVMVILDADRFGIAQLHQLRGRVGRGAAVSTCYLVGEGTTPDGEARLSALVASTDGFELAEVDLDLRGEGTIMGERQKGRNDLKLASLRRDREWVAKARDVAFALVDASPGLVGYPLLRDELDLLLDDAEADYLLRS